MKPRCACSKLGIKLGSTSRACEVLYPLNLLVNKLKANVYLK